MVIRKYQKDDREEVVKICISQSTCKKNEKNNQIICNLFLNYYLDYEPENIFVAEINNKICGYIVASAKNELFTLKMHSEYIQKTAKIDKFMSHIGRKIIKINNKEDKNGGFNFHINVKKGCEKQGIGKALMQTMQYHMKQIGKKYMYLVTRNRATDGYKFYSHIGFVEKQIYYYGGVLMVKNI